MQLLYCSLGADKIKVDQRERICCPHDDANVYFLFGKYDEKSILKTSPDADKIKVDQRERKCCPRDDDANVYFLFGKYDKKSILKTEAADSSEALLRFYHIAVILQSVCSSSTAV
jgi:hypothetical protein